MYFTAEVQLLNAHAEDRHAMAAADRIIIEKSLKLPTGGEHSDIPRS